MEIRLSVLVPTTPLLQAGAQPLKLGDILRAVVETQLKDNSFLLRLDAGGRTLTANSSANLQPGQILELEVVKLGTTPELRIVPRDSGADMPESTVQQALRLFLPKQEPLADVIQELHRLVAQARQTSSLPAPITQALENLLASIPKKSELATPEGLEKGLLNSGIFLEAKLADDADSSAEFADSDFKAQLLRVLDRLKVLRTSADAIPDTPRTTADGGEIQTRPFSADAEEQAELTEFRFEDAGTSEDIALADERIARTAERGEKDSPKLPGDSQLATPRTPEHELSTARRKTLPSPDEQNELVQGNERGAERIAQKVEAAIARVVMDQLASLPRNDAAPSVWQVEIPFTDGQHKDAAKLLITKDAKPGSAESPDSWSLTLELHPPGLGTFCARVVLKGDRIDTYLWSDTATTSDLIREQCERLRARLHGAGLAVGQLTALDRPPDSPRSENPSPPILDLRA
ncbi:flagellar hook-length control protein FliK [Methylocaldum sp. RMAD-M]|uniref:flagellar hook-length control protein FliK n=1 Tax=Methylocaldum sp. RMAD-M TaxID=2806557 RepID=UPI00111C4ED3|nr:flagellar hook-length control protein FliK [Methylocaldum sp. RMAD-M]MBP1148730.1 hypothetical protein [Methylocaldum sp. RMAD-M]